VLLPATTNECRGGSDSGDSRRHQDHYVRTLDEFLEHALQKEAVTPPSFRQPEPKPKRVGPDSPRRFTKGSV